MAYSNGKNAVFLGVTGSALVSEENAIVVPFSDECRKMPEGRCNAPQAGRRRRGGASGSALKIRNKVNAAGGGNCWAWRENFGYLVRPFKAHGLAEPDTAELVRRVTLAVAPR